MLKAGAFGISGVGSITDPRSWEKTKGQSDAKRRAAEEHGKGDSYKGPLVGMIFPLCVVENSEIKELRKCKERFVFSLQAMTAFETEG